MAVPYYYNLAEALRYKNRNFIVASDLPLLGAWHILSLYFANEHLLATPHCINLDKAFLRPYNAAERRTVAKPACKVMEKEYSPGIGKAGSKINEVLPEDARDWKGAIARPTPHKEMRKSDVKQERRHMVLLKGQMIYSKV